MESGSKKITFPKERRLCGTTAVGDLFARGEHFTVYPFKVQYIATEGTGNCRVLVSVTKKSFKRAVKRNYMKRRMREAFREEYPALEEVLVRLGKDLDFACIYLKNETTQTDAVKAKMHEIVAEFEKRLAPKGNS